MRKLYELYKLYEQYINNQYIDLKKYCTIMFYIKEIQVVLKILYGPETRLWYSQLW